MSRKFQVHIGLALLAMALPAIAQWPQAVAPPQDPLTLRQAIDTALGRNPAAVLAHAEQSAARAGVDAARTALLPQLGFTEDISAHGSRSNRCLLKAGPASGSATSALFACRCWSHCESNAPPMNPYPVLRITKAKGNKRDSVCNQSRK